MVLFQGGIISLLVISLGGTDLEIGLISTVVNICMVMGVFLAPYVEVRPRLRLFRFWIFVSTAAVSLMLLVHPINAWLGSGTAYWFLVLIVFIHRGANNLAGSAWMPYLADLLPAPIRGQYFGRMRTAWRISSLAVTLLAAWILGSDPTMLEFYLVFGIAIFFYVMRFAFLARLPQIPPMRVGEPEPLLGSIALPLRDRSFLRLLLYLFAIYLVQSAGHPFMIPFLKAELGFPSSFAVLAGAFASVGSIASLMLWGRVADARGSRFVFLSSVVVLAAALALFATAESHAVAPAGGFIVAATSFVLRGIGVSGLGIAYTVRLMSESPAERRGSYMIVARLAVGAAAALGPLVSGLVLEHLPADLPLWGGVLTKRPFFLLMAGLIVSTVPLIKLLRRIREEQTRRIVRSILYTSVHRLSNQVTMIARILQRNTTDNPGGDDR